MAKQKYHLIIKTLVPVTKKAFLEQQMKDFREEHISKIDIVLDEILTSSKIDTLIKTGVLKKVKYRGRVYFNKQDIKDVIKNQKINLKLFS